MVHWRLVFPFRLGIRLNGRDSTARQKIHSLDSGAERFAPLAGPCYVLQSSLVNIKLKRRSFEWCQPIETSILQVLKNYEDTKGVLDKFEESLDGEFGHKPVELDYIYFNILLTHALEQSEEVMCEVGFQFQWVSRLLGIFGSPSLECFG